MDKVELRTGLWWECPSCGDENLLIPERDEDGNSDLPDSVTCPTCWSKYQTELSEQDFIPLDDSDYLEDDDGDE